MPLTRTPRSSQGGPQPVPPAEGSPAAEPAAGWYAPCLFALFGLIAVVHAVTLHAGHNWGGDFSLYVMHANNLAAGQAYAETPYVLNPVNNNPSPPAYPIGFPLLLAPLVALFGLTLVPLKLVGVGSLLLSLVLVLRLIRRDLPPAYRLALTAILGLNPFLISLTDNILSDLPFLLFVLLGLWSWHVGERSAAARRRMGWAVLTGLLFYYAFLIRTLGLVLPAALVLYALVLYALGRRQSVLRPALVALAVFGGAFGLQMLISAWTASPVSVMGTEYYSEIMQRNLLERVLELAGTVADTGMAYAKHLGRILWESDPLPAALAPVLVPALLALGAVTVALVLGGWLHHVWTRLSLFDAFFVVYGAALLPWNFDQHRYLVPILPFCVFYLLWTVRVAERRLRWQRPVLLLGLLVLLGASYGWRLGHTTFGERPTDPTATDAQRMFRTIRAQLPADALIAFGKPRVLAWQTGRPSMRWQRTEAPEEVLRLFEDRGVDFVLVGPHPTDPSGFIQPFVAHHPTSFEPVYRTEHLTLYRFVPRRAASASP